MVDDRLWELIAPLILESPPPRGPGGRPRIDDRAALEEILFVLHTGRQWRDLPVKLGYASGHTAWRRLRHWQESGVRGSSTGPNPTDRGKAGMKYHLLIDRNGLPLHMLVSAANTHDSRLFEPLLESNPGVRPRRGRPSRPRRRPEMLHTDKGYDCPRCRRYLHRRGIKIRIARRGIEDKNHIGRHRWVVERTISWVYASNASASATTAPKPSCSRCYCWPSP